MNREERTDHEVTPRRSPRRRRVTTGAPFTEAQPSETDGWSQHEPVADGHPFGRIVGDMSRAAPALIDTLLDEEVAMTAWMKNYPQVALCLYDLNRFGGDLIVPMIKAEPNVWMAGTLVENAYPPLAR